MASVKVKKPVVDKIKELNDIGGLQAPLRLAKVARPLANLDLEQAISLLDELFNNAEEVSDPTGWVCEMARQLADDIGEEEEQEGDTEEIGPGTNDQIFEGLVGQPQRVVPARPGFPALPPKGLLPRLEEEEQEGETEELDTNTDDMDLIFESLVGQPPSGIPPKRVQTQQVVPARPGCPALPPPPPRPPQHPPPSMVVPARPGRPALAPNSSTRPLQQSVVPARPGCPALPPKPVHVAASSATDANTGKIKIKKQVADYIRQLNDELELSEPLRVTAVAVPLSALSVEDALSLLSGLRDGEADGCDPNSWVMAQAAAAAEVYAEEDGVEEDADEEPETKKRRIAFG